MAHILRNLAGGARRHLEVSVGLSWFVLATASAMAPFAVLGQVSGGPHDFAGGDYGNGINVCAYCHVTHGDGQETQITPLWDHQTTNSVFTLYSSSSLDSEPEQPGGITLICLSCHDGTVAVDSVAGVPGDNFIDAQFNLTPDLSDDHPVGFVYDAELAQRDGGLHDPEVTSSGISGTIRQDLLYENSTLECGSCHNVHATTPGLLRKSNQGDAFCLTCHIK